MLALVFSLGLATGLGRLRIDASLAALISGEDERIRYLGNAAENFVEHPQLLLLVHVPGLFEGDALERVRGFCTGLEAVPGVDKVTSLFHQRAPVNRRGAIYLEPLLPTIPRGDEALEETRRNLLANAVVRGQLLNDAGDTLAVFVSIGSESPGGVSHTKLLDALEGEAEVARATLPAGARIVITGVPAVKAAMWGRILGDLLWLGPLSLLVIGLVIFAFYRSPVAVLLPVLTGTLSAVATLGLMGFAGYSINVFLSIIIVLVVVLGCTEDLHILSEFRAAIASGCDPREAITRVAESSGQALLLTSATTTLGFLTLALTDLAGLRSFAVSCSFGMVINFVVTMLVAPAVLVSLPPTWSREHGAEGRPRDRLADFLAGLIERRARLIALVAILFLGLSLAGIFRLELRSDYYRFCSREGGPVEAHAVATEHFGGASMILAVLESGQSRGILSPAGFSALLQLERFLEESGAHPFGYATFFHEYRRVLGRDPASAAEPPDEAALKEFTTAMPPSFFKEFLDYDASRSAVRLRLDSPTSRDTADFEQRLRDFAEEHLPLGFELVLTGEKVIIDQLSDTVARQLFGNLALLALVTALLIGAFAGSWRHGLLSVIPNLFPLAAIFGAMGWFGIPLALGTCPVALVAFGIAVDDTIHFLLRYRKHLDAGERSADAAFAALRHELHPVLATSVVVGCGFLVLMLSPAPVNFDIGLLFVISTGAALFADLLVMPLILRSGGSR